MPLAPQRDTRVTEEIRNPMGWVVGRTQRLTKLAELSEIQDIIQRVVTHLDNFCAVEDTPPLELEGNVLRTRALKYIRIRLGSRPCFSCEGKGVVGTGLDPCPTCEGTGIR